MIRQMGSVALGSPDPVRAAGDLVSIVGLRESASRDGVIYLTANRRLHDVTYTKTDTAQCLAVGLEAIDRDAVDEVARRVASEGLTILSDRPMRDGVEHAISFVAPGGMILEVHTAVQRNQPSVYNGPGARVRRGEHVSIMVPDHEAAAEFLEKVLGMKMSDQTGDGSVRWFRAADGFHHAVALGAGKDKPWLHHYAFDHHAVEDLVRIADLLVIEGRSLAWGPGRHGAGENLFTYYLDPDGCVVENSVEMARIDNDALYKPGSWDISLGFASRWINTWGTPPTDAFINGGIPFAQHG